jgi:hypothetical protein
MEVVAACLAADLGLPVPEPFLIEVSPQWADIVPDQARRAIITASSPVAFGSKVMTGGYAQWRPIMAILESVAPTALAILTFDAMVQNPDRQSHNPNCLTKGDDIRIIDHEACFFTKGLLGWQPPWNLGGLKPFETPGYHIFREGLRRRAHNFAPIRDAWSGVSNGRLSEYQQALPAQWATATVAVTEALTLVRGVRDNIDACLTEVERVLK